MNREDSPKTNRAGGDDIERSRRRRVREYCERSVARKDPLLANVGSLNSGLMGLALRLEEAIRAAFANNPPDAQQVARLLPMINTHLQMARQIDRYATLERREVERRSRSRRPPRSGSRQAEGGAPRLRPDEPGGAFPPR